MRGDFARFGTNGAIHDGSNRKHFYIRKIVIENKEGYMLSSL
jgi:hypothetical protein